MKRLLAISAAAVIALVPIACNNSPQGGSPGTDDSFHLSGPGNTIPTTIKQGDTQTVKVSVDRDKNFHKTVSLSVKAPDSIKADLDRTTVKDGESPDVNVKVHPTDGAVPGDYTVTVTGTPESGAPTNLDVKVKVISK